MPDEWKSWYPGTLEEEDKFTSLVCADCTKTLKNLDGDAMGCEVLMQAVEHIEYNIEVNKKKERIRCNKQALKGEIPRCKNTPDMFMEINS